MMSPTGFDNLLFFMGIVEDVSDETNSGRVKVRAFGIHPPVDAPDGGVPTEELPWAIPLNGSYRGSVQIPRKADWVFGFFADGRDAQHPFLIGSLEGINMAAMNNSGAPNENGVLAASTAAYRTYGEPPLHHFVTGENLEETPELVKATIRKAGIRMGRITDKDGTMRDGMGWDEHAPVTARENFRSVVLPARFGDSFVGISDHEEEESIVISHSSGSHIQIDPSGHIKIRSSGNLQIISEDNNYEYSGGTKNETHESGWNVLVQDGSAVMEFNGDLHQVVHGDYNLNVAGRMACTVGLGYELSAGRLALESVTEHINIRSKEKLKMYSRDITSIESDTQMYLESNDTLDMRSKERMRIGTEDKLDIRSKAYMKIGSEAKIDIHSTGADIAIDGSANIWLNSGKSVLSDMSKETPEIVRTPKIDQPTSQSIGTGNWQAGVYAAGSNTTSNLGGSDASSLDDMA